MTREALVSVGIPTYNRPTSLRRAIESVLEQDHRALEVVVSDDASTDPRTEQVARELADSDERIRVFRQPTNLGHAGNYRWVLEAAAGDYFMWLSDDDWLDRRYVSRCLEELTRRRRTVLVAGSACYYQDGLFVIDERPITLDSVRPGLRVVSYFAQVSVNGPLFGLSRRSDRLEVSFPDKVGGDWTLVSALASRGQVRTLTDVHIHRSISGLGSDPEGLAKSFGLPGVMARHHHFVVAARMWVDIAARDPGYRSIGPLGRIATATLVAVLVVVRFPGYGLARRLLRALGLAHLEDRTIAWIRARDRSIPPR